MTQLEWKKILDNLENGTVRSAGPQGNGEWKVNIEVKQAILEAFKAGQNVEFQEFIDKDTILPQSFTVEKGVRIVPGGSSVRRGAYVSKGVIIMPPSYINIGAYVDSGSMVDSHVLVGSCAQIGKNVHLSAGVQIGGVLEPIGQSPVIVEDNAFIGAGSVIVEGIRVCQNAVLAPGVYLSKGVAIYDSVNEKVLEKGASVPENAVIIPGTRPIKTEWAQREGLQISCPIIVKYRDKKTDASLILEDLLR